MIGRNPVLDRKIAEHRGLGSTSPRIGAVPGVREIRLGQMGDQVVLWVLHQPAKSGLEDIYLDTWGLPLTLTNHDFN